MPPSPCWCWRWPPSSAAGATPSTGCGARRLTPCVGFGSWLAFVLVLLIASPARAANKQAFIDSSGFHCSPSSASCAIDQGDVVYWRNNDTVAHTVTADDGSWTTGSIAPGARGFAHLLIAGHLPVSLRRHEGLLHRPAQRTPPPPPPPPPPVAAPRHDREADRHDRRARSARLRRGQRRRRSTRKPRRRAASNSSRRRRPEKPRRRRVRSRSRRTRTTAAASSGIVLAALIVPLLGVLAGGGYALYRLGGRAAHPPTSDTTARRRP